MPNNHFIFDNLEQLGIGSRFLDTIADMLECADMFRDFSRQDIETIAQYIQAYSAPAGTTVLEEGDKESYMFIVVEGKINIFKTGADYKHGKKLATVRAGKTIGEMSLIDGMPHSASAITSEATKLLLITRNNFESLTQAHPELALSLIRKIAMLMSLRLRQTSGILVDFLD